MRTTRQLGTLLVTAAMAVGCASSDGAGASSEALVEEIPLTADGVSFIENRRVYADPDEGEFVVPLTPGFCLPNEFCIHDLEGRAQVRVEYSRSRNTVDFYADFWDGALPYRPSYEKSWDDSTEFNPQLTEVHDANWQLWIISSLGGTLQPVDFYYDLATQRALGTRFDFEPHTDVPFPAPGTYFTVSTPSTRMLCSPQFEGNPDGSGHFHFQLAFDRLEDAAGSPGAIAANMPFDFCHPDYVTNYWTQHRLPDSEFQSFDDFLNSINHGESIGFAVSAEPQTKPASLAYRDNTFIGWGNAYPQVIPEGWGIDVRSGGNLRRVPANDFQNPDWPASLIDLCGGAL